MMSTRGPIIRVLLVAGLMVASVATSRAVDLPAAVCVARGPLIVTETNEVRFSASGFCGPFAVSINDFLGPRETTYPQWTGGCGYGPGPFPKLRIAISLTDPTGALTWSRQTFWEFPDTVIGAHRASVPNSTTRVLIKDFIYVSQYGVATGTGAQIGSGALITRLGGSCDVTSAKKASAYVVFALYPVLTSI
jgi:hypothetical protein